MFFAHGGGRIRRLGLLSLSMCLLLCLPNAALCFQVEDLSSDFRTWTSRNGKFTVNAKLLSVEDDKADLEKKDGRVIQLPLDKLSKADVAFVEELRKKAVDPDNPFASAAEKDPFAGGKVESRGTGRSRASRSSKGASEAQVIDATQVFPNVNLEEDGWKVIIDAHDEALSKRKLFSKPIAYPPLTEEHEFHDKVDIRVDRSGSAAVVSTMNTFEDESQLHVVDLATGKTLASERVPIKKLKVFAVDVESKQVLTYEDVFGGSKSDLLHFHRFDDLAKPFKTWKLASFRDKNGYRPKSGFFVGTNRLLTVGDNCVLWDVEQAEPIYAAPIKARNSGVKDGSICLSSNRRILAFLDRSSVSIIDVETGKLLGTIPSGATTKICISPSGEFLAGMDKDGQIWVWDLYGNQMIQEFKSPGRKSLEWTDDRNLLVDDKYLMDIEYRVCVWEYTSENKDSLVSQGGGNFLMNANGNLLMLKLPHGDLTEKIEDLDPDDLLLIRPGDEFAIDFDLPFDDDQQREIRESLEQRLQEKGYSINKQAALTLRGRVSTDEPETAEVRPLHGFGRGRSTTIKYTAHRSKIEILKDGKVIWQSSRYHGPAYHIHTQGDETLQEYADRVSDATPSLFMSFKIPTNLATLPGGKPLGKSRLISSRRK